MPDPLSIVELISEITKGHIRIPSFQRGFVWEPENVADLMDSIYKGYPFGTLLFWHTRTPLKTDRNLGPFVLPPQSPEYPIDYILDGQQRATSIFGVFQTQLSPVSGKEDKFKICFDLQRNASAQDSQFRFVSDEEFDPKRHFPLRILFDPPAYRKFLRDMDDSIGAQVDDLYTRFTQAKIPVQYFASDERATVAIVFERINRMGVELDTLQLLSAWSWSEDFDLQEEFKDLAQELSPFGFNDVGEDSDLLLRCCAAIISQNASRNALINLKGVDVRNRFDEIRSGVIGAVDFLKGHLKAESAQVLPYTTVLIPLSVFFATEREQSTHPDSEQHATLTRWLWRTFFTRRYSKRLEQLNQDIVEMQKLKNREANTLGEFACDIDESFFIDDVFNLRNVNTKTFILMLASEAPLDFMSGSPILLGPVLRESNKKEFHHVFPKAFLSSLGFEPSVVNALVNLCMLPRAANNKISGRRPSEYRTIMPNDDDKVVEILRRALCPDDIFHDDYKRFVTERAKILVHKANALMGKV